MLQPIILRKRLRIIIILSFFLWLNPIFLLASETTTENKIEKATFAGGCFWCMEAALEGLKGVSGVVSGYTGGNTENPSYEEVLTGKTGHYEAVEVTFDSSVIDYSDLLETFWRHINPTDAGGQFADRGSQYQTAIFYHNELQEKMAKESKAKLQNSGRFKKKIVTEILPVGPFYPAESYHQDYYKKNQSRYEMYRIGSGRAEYIESKWGENEMKSNGDKDFQKHSQEELKEVLTPLQYHVTQENGTERPFQNEFWDNKKEGIYVDIVSGEPLFSSTHKFDSGTGWPSFYQPLEKDNIVENQDRSLMMVRTEVRSKLADSHLGHVFNDGPQPTGLRYCINSAALRFIPRQDLEKEGYGQYLILFEEN